MNVLTLRRLNRVALHRQMLLQREHRDVVDTVRAIGGVNAQTVNDPYLALHSRLDDFALDHLTAALEDGTVVRSCLHRATQHMVTATDFAWLHPTIAPVLARAWRGVWRRRVDGVDVDALLADARGILRDQTLTRPELGRLLAATRPEADRTALAWTVQYLLPTIHPAPSGVWDNRGPIPVRLADDDANPEPDLRRLVRAYLAAYGPATPSDIRAWSGVPGLREAVAGMTGELVEFRDELGRTLVDLPEAPRPEEDTPAPVRLLAGFDNLLLAYDNRTRVMTDEARRRVCVGDLIDQVLLVDGFVGGVWRLDREQRVLTISPFDPLAPADRDQAEAEGLRLLQFVTGDDAHDVRVVNA